MKPSFADREDAPFERAWTGLASRRTPSRRFATACSTYFQALSCSSAA
jgi:hypothetical protein